MNTNVWTRRLVNATLAASLVAPVGCSISDSLSDSSDSSSDSSTSSSDSSTPGNKQRAYRDDVRDYTAAYVKSGGRITEFNQKIGDLAKGRGIANWEDEPATYDGIGRGLGKARVSQVELDTYVHNLANGSSDKAQAMRQGYAAAQ